jgi:hypothetical protein
LACDQQHTVSTGQLYISYDIEFFTPQIVSTKAGAPSGVSCFTALESVAYPDGVQQDVEYAEVKGMNNSGVTLSQDTTTFLAPVGAYRVTYQGCTTAEGLDTSSLVNFNIPNIAPPSYVGTTLTGSVTSEDTYENTMTGYWLSDGISGLTVQQILNGAQAVYNAGTLIFELVSML